MLPGEPCQPTARPPGKAALEITQAAPPVKALGAITFPAVQVEALGRAGLSG